MKKLFALILAAVMLASFFSMNAFADDAVRAPVWSDYISAVKVLDLDKAKIDYREENGVIEYDDWYMPKSIQFVLLDGSTVNVEVDTSGMETPKDNVYFTAVVAPGVALTFYEYLVAGGDGSVYYGIIQETTDGETLEVFSEGIGEEENGGFFARIIAYFKDIIRTIIIAISSYFAEFIPNPVMPLGN